MELKYDFHIHSCLSPCADNDMTPENIAGMAYINHLQAVALTDHNSCKNCEAFQKAAQQYGLFAICGMELTTSEEVHVVCLFPTLQDAMDFDSYVEDHRLNIPNSIDIFGNQLLYGPDDRLIGEYEYSLIPASDISFSDLPDLIEKFHGVHIPAHLDRHSNSLLSNLGFIPTDSRFDTYEIYNPEEKDGILDRNPSLRPLRCINDSDAHRLYKIKDGEAPGMEVREVSFDGIFRV